MPAFFLRPLGATIRNRPLHILIMVATFGAILYTRTNI
nr:MAG TPA: hypothetical protein [Microviridae sp.]